MKAIIGPYPKTSKKQQKISVRIDKHDTWSMDVTLAHIVVPMLKQLRDGKGGAPNVDDEDVPAELKRSAAAPTKNDWDTDDNYFKRWEYVLNEMLFSFESKLTQWVDIDEDLTSPEITMREKRIQNGFELFGKYYQNLWE